MSEAVIVSIGRTPIGRAVKADEGSAFLCAGGGQGTAMIVERLS